MQRAHLISLAGAASLMLLLPLVLCRSASAQGAPAIVWTAADGAGTVTFSPTGQLLADNSGGTTIVIRNASNGALVRSIRDRSGIGAFAFSANGQLIADGRTNGTSLNLKVFRVSDGTLVWSLGGHNNSTRAVAFSPFGNLLASGGDDRTVKLWQVSNGTLARTLPVGSRVRSVAFSPDGGLLASGDAASVKLWRAADGALVRALTPPFSGQVTSVAFSPDGSQVAGGSLDGTVRVWRVSTGALSYTLTLPASSPNGSVTSFAFSPNRFSLITGNDEVAPAPEHGTVRFWRAADGAFLRLFDQQTGLYVSSVAFSPLGTVYAYSRALDGQVIVARSPF